jgi:hypothetical protein
MLPRIVAGAALLLAAVALAGPAEAADTGFSVTCANGRNFHVRSRAVSDEGDLVTGYLVVRRHTIPIRLIPMGEGYRYAAAGLWLDGHGSEAVLDWGTRHALPCTLQRD